jgi:hypothetical protein
MFRDAIWSVVVVCTAAVAFVVGQHHDDLDFGWPKDVRGASAFAPSMAVNQPAAIVAGTAPRPAVQSAAEAPPRRPEPSVAKGQAAAILTDDRGLRDAPRSLPASAAPSALAAKPAWVRDGRSASDATIRSLQGELKRLGCYDGPIDGDWGPASHFAAAKFTRAVNAALPTDAPDEALLALSRQYAGPACNGLATSDIVTAATKPAWQANVTPAGTTAAPGPTVGTRADDPAQAHSPAQATTAPRVVRTDGSLYAPSTTTEEPSMALGVDPTTTAALSAASTGSITGGSDARLESPTTRPRLVRPAEQRAKRSSRGRASRKHWTQRAFQTMNLDGS